MNEHEQSTAEANPQIPAAEQPKTRVHPSVSAATTPTLMPTTTAIEQIVQQPTTWIARVNLGRQMRAAGEQMVATALRERLNKAGEALWLKECENEWGWSRTTAYNHLNPELLQKDRDRAAARRSDGLNIEKVEPEPPRPLEEIAADLHAMGLKKPAGRTRTCSSCGETFPHVGPWSDFTKHRGTCAQPTVIEAHGVVIEDAAEPATRQVVRIYASQQGKRGAVKFWVNWDEGGGGFTQGPYATLEEAKTFCPCSMDPEKVERIVVPGVKVLGSIPSGMLGHGGSYVLLDGKKVSEIPPALYEPEEGDEPDTEEIEQIPAEKPEPAWTCPTCGTNTMGSHRDGCAWKAQREAAGPQRQREEGGNDSPESVAALLKSWQFQSARLIKKFSSYTQEVDQDVPSRATVPVITDAMMTEIAETVDQLQLEIERYSHRHPWDGRKKLVLEGEAIVPEAGAR